ncbi:MAG: hypothetical protein MR531_09890, partial [Lachnospiraceae bacterium]|nr:hypothetical protein [Lachnospiraceae bacterium]
KIQRSALNGNKFCLSEEELECFCRCFPEGNRYNAKIFEIKELYEVLNKIVHQAIGSNFEYEVEYVCRKMFALLVQYSDIFKSK